MESMTPKMKRARVSPVATGEERPAALTHILARLRPRRGAPLPKVQVSGITCDPAGVRPGDLYVALEDRVPGSIGQAVSRGAVAVVTQRGPDADPGVPVVVVQDAIRALGHMADRLFGRPSKSLRTAAFTGSTGKDAAAILTQAALQSAALQTHRIGLATDGFPSPHRLQEALRDLRDQGTKACVIEASSRDLVLGRFEGTTLHCGVFLGIHPAKGSRYHGGFEEYLDAKAELFRSLPRTAVAAFNRDDPAWEILAEETRAKVVTFGLESAAEVRGSIRRMDLRGTELVIATPLGPCVITTPLVGRQHARHALAALTVSLALGADMEAAVRGIASVAQIPGSLERLPMPAPHQVFLDVAQDVASVQETLAALRPLVPGRLVVVFGAPSAPEERAPVAALVERFADAMVITSGAADQAQGMGPIKELARGLEAPRNALLDPDRRQAIGLALDGALPSDVILILSAGDGSGDRLHVRDWCLQALEAEAAFGYREGA